jgi:exo-1,4-beta-D-glucosaminidase
VVVNSYYRSFPSCKVTAKVYNLDLTEKFSRTVTVDVGSDSSTPVLTIPPIEGLSGTYFVRLWMNDNSGKSVSSNFYWLSTQPDVSNWARGSGRFTPIEKYADLTALESLPEPRLTVTSRKEEKGADEVMRVKVRNPTPRLAFFVHLTIQKGKQGEDIRPIYWDDNYITLWPGEEREVTATYRRTADARVCNGRTSAGACIEF